MSVSALIEQMSLEDKLLAMEQLWDDLCRDEKQVPLPEWHKEVLDEREKLIAEGKAQFSDWEDVKARLSKKSA